jgi:uncharacterized membrane protein
MRLVLLPLGENRYSVFMSATSTDDGEQRGEPIAESGSGLDSNLAGALSYLLGFVTGIVFYVIDSDDDFVRWHAAQSIALSVAVMAFSIVISIISTILFSVLLAGAMTGGFGFFALISGLLSLLWTVVGLGALAIWVYLMFTAYNGQTKRIPIIANFADRIAEA